MIRLTRVAPPPVSRDVSPAPVPPLAARPQKPVRMSRTIWVAAGAVLAAVAAVILLGALIRIQSPNVSYTAGSLPAGAPVPADVVAAAGKLILLPDETPTVATVTDMEPLRGQAFFERAQVGDVVLMYPRAARAILYRPSANLIIEVAPIALDQ